MERYLQLCDRLHNILTASIKNLDLGKSWKRCVHTHILPVTSIKHVPCDSETYSWQINTVEIPDNQHCSLFGGAHACTVYRLFPSCTKFLSQNTTRFISRGMIDYKYCKYLNI